MPESAMTGLTLRLIRRYSFRVSTEPWHKKRKRDRFRAAKTDFITATGTFTDAKQTKGYSGKSLSGRRSGNRRNKVISEGANNRIGGPQ